MKALLGLLAFGLSATAAHAVTYTTSITIPHDPSAATSNFDMPGAATNGPAYTIKTGIDSQFLYVDVATVGPADGNDFSNIYLGGATFNDNLVIEVTNHRAISTAPGSMYQDLTGTGYTFTSTGTASTGYDISFALPISYLESDPYGVTSPALGVGDQVRVSGSQSYGYSYVGGQSNFGSNRLGSQIIPGSAPEPAAWVMMLVGFGTIGAAMRRRGARMAAL